MGINELKEDLRLLRERYLLCVTEDERSRVHKWITDLTQTIAVYRKAIHMSGSRE